MKKFLILFIIPLLLCGCEQKPQEYLVSAIGFDYELGLYNVSFETLIVNTESEGQKLSVINGKGRTIKEAIDEIKRQSTMPVLLSHCSVVVVGKSISDTKLKGILRFCKENREITLSTLFISTDNAAELLDSKPISSVTVGYDLTSLLKTQEDEEKIKLKNRLFEIYENSVFELPHILKNKTGYYFEKQ